MILIDAHLDLAYNALRGRDVLRPAREQPADEQGTPSVGLPDLRGGGVGMICGTIFCTPASALDAIHPRPEEPGYRNAREAAEMAWRQVEWYHRQAAEGEVRLVRHGGDAGISAGAAGVAPRSRAIPMVLLMEGADPIAGPEDVAPWFDAGVRAVGLAWQRTRYAGGTGAPGPLTSEGRALVPALDAAGMIHDLSHLAEASFWDLLDLTTGPVMASHSNCRAIVPTDRQLSDEMIRAIAGRGGVIGINLFDRFLLPPQEYGRRRATLADVVRHIRHICDLLGSARHLGIGSDMDGGFGAEHLPEEIVTAQDLPRLAEAVNASGFSDEDVQNIMAGNWTRFFDHALPWDSGAVA
jgi:membrane dipeptidase